MLLKLCKFSKPTQGEDGGDQGGVLDGVKQAPRGPRGS